MFENFANEAAGQSLVSDIKNNLLPGALLFSGENASGKLTGALEVARVLSCESNIKGNEDCTCASCMRFRSLVSNNLMLMGPRDCSLEISASREGFLNAAKINAPYLKNARYLFIKSVRKLTLRFNSLLWSDDNNLSKIGSLMEDINDNLEQLEEPRQLPDFEHLQKICNKLAELTLKLENDFLYDSIPISQIRNLEDWAFKKVENGKKTVIIENADRMLPGVRNALLKILEEPPADCVFILLTSKRNAIMQTILSRVRNYNFPSLSPDIQKNIIRNVFYCNNFNGSIYEYLLTFLPVSPDDIKFQADIFYNSIADRVIPDIPGIIKKCGSFNPKIEFRLFIKFLMEKQKVLMETRQGCEFCFKTLSIFRECIDNVFLYNQSAASALEILLREISSLNIKNGGIMKI